MLDLNREQGRCFLETDPCGDQQIGEQRIAAAVAIAGSVISAPQQAANTGRCGWTP